MSHKTKIKTKLDNKQYLIKGLEKMGFNIQVAEEGQSLTTKSMYGVEEPVDILITKTPGNNTSYQRDVGLKEQEDGTFTAIGDFYHLRDANGNKLSEKKFAGIVTAYSKEEEVTDRLSNLMFQMEDGTREESNEELSFTLQRWVD